MRCVSARLVCLCACSFRLADDVAPVSTAPSTLNNSGGRSALYLCVHFLCRSLHFAHRLYWFLNSYLPGLPSVSPAAAAVAVLPHASKVAVPLAHAVTAQGKHAALSLWKQVQLQAPPVHKVAHTSSASRGTSLPLYCGQLAATSLHHAVHIYALIWLG